MLLEGISGCSLIAVVWQSQHSYVSRGQSHPKYKANFNHIAKGHIEGKQFEVSGNELKFLSYPLSLHSTILFMHHANLLAENGEDFCDVKVSPLENKFRIFFQHFMR